MESALIYLIVSISTLLAQVLSGKSRLSFLLFIPFYVCQVWFCTDIYYHIGEFRMGYFMFDLVGWLFVVTLTVVSLPALYHMYVYAAHRGTTPDLVAKHNGALTALISAMTMAFICDNLGLMWSFVEATTVASAILLFMTATPYSWKLPGNISS